MYKFHTKHLSRRRFCVASAIAGAGLWNHRADVAFGSPDDLEVTDIQRHEICIPYRDFNAEALFRYHGVKLQLRTIYIVKTNRDVEGYGEAWGPGPAVGAYEKYIGSNPFDWINAESDLAMNMAMYDIMGKYLGVPAWKLIGPKVRNWIPVAAWTVSQTPEALAEEVKQVSQMGYRWLKYHIDEIQNVIDQTAAMQKVAPPGFKLHFDFNANSNIEAVFPVLRELEKFAIVGRIEDPINPNDREGYRLLREKSRLSILIHHGPASFLRDNLCDGLMAGHAPIGNAAKIAALAEHTRKPIMLQQAGGTINQAFLAHEAAVFPMATLDHVNLCHLWKDDITTVTMPVVGSSVQVPQGSGLGVKIDREKLKRYEHATRPKYEPFLVRIRYNNGPTIYTRHDPDGPGSTDNMRFLNRLLNGNVPGPLPAYANEVRSEFLDQKYDRFDELWHKTRSGPFVE